MHFYKNPLAGFAPNLWGDKPKNIRRTCEPDIFARGFFFGHRGRIHSLLVCSLTVHGRCAFFPLSWQRNPAAKGGVTLPLGLGEALPIFWFWLIKFNCGHVPSLPTPWMSLVAVDVVLRPSLDLFLFPQRNFFASPHCQPLCVIKDIVGVPGRGISVTKRSTTTPADMVLQPSFDQFLFLSISTTRRSTMATPEGHPYRSPQQGYRQGRLRRSWTCYCGLRSDDHLRRPRTQWCGLHSSDFYFPGGFFLAAAATSLHCQTISLQIWFRSSTWRQPCRSPR